MDELCRRDLGCPFIKSIFSNIDMYSVLIDKTGVVVYCSEKFKKFFNNEEVIGKKISELISKSAYEDIRKVMLEVIFTNRQVIRDILFQDNLTYKVIAYPVIDNNDEMHVTHLVLTALNVTENKKLEEENAELRRKLEESNSIKSIFLSNISHELRTPMNAIIGFSDILLQNGHNQSQVERFVKSINSNAKHLDELLNNILDYSKIESNEFDILYENFSLNDLIDELKEIFDDVNYKKNLDFVKLEFIKGEDKKIISDYLRLKQVLFNIISNSIKFTDKGYIRISFDEGKEFLTFKIEDTGVGIPEDKLQFVFDRFWQGDSTSRKKYSGAGLGLSISKSIVEMLNGEITVESTFGKGTTFYVKIPLEEIKQSIIIKHKDKNNFSGKTIMIVDELPISYSLLGIYLHSLDINIISQNSGKEALKIYKKQKDKIELIILDVNLPDMDSIELSKKLKKINENSIIITKSAIEQEDNRYVDFHLRKPINKDRLLDILNLIWRK